MKPSEAGPLDGIRRRVAATYTATFLTDERRRTIRALSTMLLTYGALAFWMWPPGQAAVAVATMGAALGLGTLRDSRRLRPRAAETFTDDELRVLVHQARECPDCHAAVLRRELLCPSCGSSRRAALESPPQFWIIVALLAIGTLLLV